ncbi:MAG: hypothetical protein K2W82_11325 [Candidatus Obscuribacterales bacterium]|nr:hypothetical protein [Candidatus Obscuribacterales bacterium]
MNLQRRQLLTAAAALGSSCLTGLGSNLLATEPSGDLKAYPGIDAEAAALAATEKNILGPYYRPGAPYRAKITPPHEPGTVLLVNGIVRAADTGKPLPFAVLDIWQANEQGHYDNENDANPNAKPANGLYLLRARLVTNEDGYYEYETIHPGAYEYAENAWRPAHIHYMVSAHGYKQLVTQMYFDGDKHNKTDQFIHDSLIMPVASKTSHGKSYEAVTFNIVLAKT